MFYYSSNSKFIVFISGPLILPLVCELFHLWDTILPLVPSPFKMLSPGKLRSMILGGGGGGGGSDKKRAQGAAGEDDYLDEELESTSLSTRSRGLKIQDSGDDGYDNCKDVYVVSFLPGFPPVATAGTSALSEISYDSAVKDHSLVSSRVKYTDESSMHYDSGNDTMSVSSSAFEFQKSERAQQRVPLAPFSKPAPSKWDDAQKWIASPTSSIPKNGQATQGIGSRKTGYFGYGSRQSSTKVVVEVTDQKMIPYDEPDTKQIDSSLVRKQSGMQKVVDWDAYQCTSESYSKPVVMMDNFIGESAMAFSRHDSSLAIRSATSMIPPPSTARSVSMRDMGTEMTPLASQEPSRTGTPVRATTPTRSPSTSRHSSPGRAAPIILPTDPLNDHLDGDIKESSEKEFMKTRREIMLLGTQLGKMNIAAWASKDNENKEASASINTVASEQPSQSVIETRAVAWEEAEKAKYMARFKREEIRIQAWENHQKAKTEAEMRKTEVEVEKMRAKAQDKLMNKLASVQHKAEERHAQAEAKRNRCSAKAEKQAEYIRKTGRIPSSFRCCNWCLWCS